MNTTKWLSAFASVIGKGHLKNQLPCQDYCDICLFNQDWGIAVVADGAGSAKRSHIGAKKTVDVAIETFGKILENQNWMQTSTFPTITTWHTLSLQSLRSIYQSLQSFAKEENYPPSDLACTLIVLVFSPQGLLLTHIGDGRAAYANTKGEWKSMMTPYNGETANETVFITSPIWEIANIDEYIESQIIAEPPMAFCLLTDGMEKACFEVNLYDAENSKYYDPNLPYPKFFHPCQKALLKMHKEGKSQEAINAVWANFLTSGNQVLRNEEDDKTLVMGISLTGVKHILSQNA